LDPERPGFNFDDTEIRLTTKGQVKSHRPIDLRPAHGPLYGQSHTFTDA
jgi:hypothetical protein